MHLTKKTVLSVVVIALVLSVLAVVAANRVTDAESGGTEPEDHSTISYTPDAQESDSADDVQADDGDVSNVARLTEESHNAELAADIVWPEGVAGNNYYSYTRNGEPEQAAQEEPDDSGAKSPLEVLEGTYLISVTVLDGGGYPIRGAEVIIGGEAVLTDATGSAEMLCLDAETELIVAADGYISYYEELLLEDPYRSFTVIMDDADQIRTLLDSAELHPYRTDNEDLENFLNVLCAELFYEGMDTYDRVKACYDWLIANTYYKSPNHWDTAKNYWLCAYQCMVDGYGTCNCYSAAFTAMMRHIGLDCYVVGGSTTANEGGYTGHDWTTVCIGDKWYIFDPQVEDAIAGRTRSKEVTYVRFCLSDPHAKYHYSSSRANRVKQFQNYLNEHGTYLTD